MKRNILLIVLFVVCSMSHAQERPANQVKEPAETIVFDKSEHDFGDLVESNNAVTYGFSFKNKGDAPLVITKVNTSCGCTASEWSQEPIAPGKKGTVKVSYTPNGQKGEITKTITVFSNGNPDRKTLLIKGNIK